jgi:hypothetical protein
LAGAVEALRELLDLGPRDARQVALGGEEHARKPAVRTFQNHFNPATIGRAAVDPSRRQPKGSAVPPRAAFDMQSTPALTVGQLADDLDRLRELTADGLDLADVCSWHDRYHLVGSLRRMGAFDFPST